MSLVRPTLEEIIARLRADCATKVPELDPYSVASPLDAILGAVGWASNALYGYLDSKIRASFPDTAEAEELDRIGSVLWGVDRNAGGKASGPVVFYGTDGTVIPSATIVVNSTGLRFRTLLTGYIGQQGFPPVPGQWIGPVSAKEIGSAYNLLPLTPLELETPIEGVDSVEVMAGSGFTGGRDAESDSDYRGRILERIQQPPQGGNTTDFHRWALEVSGVTRAWVRHPSSGSNLITIYIVNDDADPITASAELITAVEDYIEERRPLCSDVEVETPTLIQLDPAITLTPNTSSVQAAVTAEIADLLYREAEPGGTLLISHLREAVSAAAGETDNTITSPTANVVVNNDELLVVGTPVYS